MFLYDFSWLKNPSHQKLGQVLSYQARFVGGCVRNTLLGLPFDDFDLATPLTPEEVISVLRQNQIKVIPTGLKHGTVTAIIDSVFYEITTLRTDTSTDGRHAVVAFTKDYQTDAKRRDFTINALYLDFEGRLYDYYGGIDDLKSQHIRFIGNPVSRIHEDYLRILRFFRIFAFYGKNIDPSSYKACCDLKENLKKLSKERITKEFLRLLEAPCPEKSLSLLQKGGFIDFLLPDAFEKGLENISTALRYEKKTALQFPPLLRLLFLSKPPYPYFLLSNKQMRLITESIRKDFSKDRTTFLEDLYDVGPEILYMRYILWCIAKQKEIDKTLKDFEKESQELPVLPFTGKDIQEKGFEGKYIAFALKHLRQKFIENNFKLSQMEYEKILKNLPKKEVI